MKKRLQQWVALLRGDSRHYSRCSMPFSRCSTPAESGIVSRQVRQIVQPSKDLRHFLP